MWVYFITSGAQGGFISQQLESERGTQDDGRFKIPETEPMVAIRGKDWQKAAVGGSWRTYREKLLDDNLVCDWAGL